MTPHLLAAALALAAPAASASPTVKLLTDTTARAYPGSGAQAVSSVAARRPLTGAPTVLPVIGRAEADGRPWVRVRLPQRPNGSTGWVPADATVAGSTPWRVEVSRKRRVATILRAGRVQARFRVVVGKAATPTPTGVFFVTERVRQPRGAAIGPWALATSAHSNVLRQFGGGPGQIALHGRTGLSDPLGSAASHGCVRLADSAVRWVAARVPAGTTVAIS